MIGELFMNEIEQLLKLSPPVAASLALLICGKLLKLSPIANRWIPAILCVLGAVIFPFVAPERPDLSHPVIYNAILGFLAGGAAVGIHSVLVRIGSDAGGNSEETKPKTEVKP
jgi:hypothetical protein